MCDFLNKEKLIDNKVFSMMRVKVMVDTINKKESKVYPVLYSL